jgi:hypothetical protein
MSRASRCYRQKCSIPCRCQWSGGSSSSRIVDLSFDGAILTQTSPVPDLGSRVVVELEIGSKYLPFPGEVVYTHSTKGGAFGVHFSGDSEDNLGRLQPLYLSTTK